MVRRIQLGLTESGAEQPDYMQWTLALCSAERPGENEVGVGQ